MKDVKRVPKLRFSEFNEELMNVGFTELGKILIGLTHKPEYLDNGIPFLSSKNISKGYIDFEDIHYISSEKYESMSKSSKPKKGDILFTRVGSNLGNPIVFEEDLEFAIFVSLGIFRTNNKASNFFIKHWMDSNYFWRQVEQKVAGGAKNNLNTGWLKEFKLNIPQLPEQQKIANFLSLVDIKIDQLQQKKNLLEQYKKGVMQQLFSQQLRFKADEGNVYPDWEEKKLGEILDYEQPTNYLVSSTEYSDDYKTPVLTAGKTFILGYTDETDNIFKDELPVIIFDDFTTATQFVDFPFKAKSSAMKILKAKKSENIKFIYESMQNIQFEIGGHGRHWISKFSVMKIPYPCLEEQTKIANFLSAIDKKIELVNTQIENTQLFKKGLLQQMFV